MTDLNVKKLSTFVKRMMPRHIADEYPNFVEFFKEYFVFLEQENNPVEIINKLLYDRDIDNSIDVFFEEYRSTFVPDMPKQNRADLKLVIKNIRDYYSQKGNEDSFAFLFRMIYNEPIEFYYPRVDILRASDGKWHKPTHIVMKKPDGTYPDYIWLKDNFLSRSVIGLSSGDIGYIEAFVEVASPDELLTNPNPATVWAAVIKDSVGAFIEGDTLRYRDDPNSPTAVIATSATDRYPAIEIQPGRWIGTDGFLSSNKYLQDNFYYQEHSYQVRVAMSSNFYWRTIRKNVHPAGTIFFGVVDFLDGILTKMTDSSSTYLNDTAYYNYELGAKDTPAKIGNMFDSSTLGGTGWASPFNWHSAGMTLNAHPDPVTGLMTATTISQTTTIGASRWIAKNTVNYEIGKRYVLSGWVKKVSGIDAQPSVSLWAHTAGTQILNVTNQWQYFEMHFTGNSTIYAGVLIGYDTQGAPNDNVFAFARMQLSEVSGAFRETTNAPSKPLPLAVEERFAYDFQSIGVASFSTYAFVEKMRELHPYASINLANAFDNLQIQAFDINANAGFPYGRPAEITII